MKFANLSVLVFILVFLSQSAGQILSPNFNGLEAYSNRSLAMGIPKFANPTLYNSFDQGGSVLGLLEREKKEFILETRYLSSEKSNSDDSRETYSGNLILPSMYFNIPGMLGANIYYRKIGDEALYKPKNNSVAKFSNNLNLHNVGFDVAVGLKSGYAQAGMSLHMIVYGEAADKHDNERFLFAVPKVEVAFGSQPHKLVRFGGKFGGSISYDSLRDGQEPKEIFERHGTLNFPSWGVNFDFGDTNMLPLLINMSLNYDQDIIWGNYKNLDENDSEFAYNSVRRPRYSFDWAGMYMFENQGIKYNPALKFGFWRQSHERYIQSDSDRKNPYSTNGQCIDGINCAGWSEDGMVHEWDLSGVKLGLGFNINILNYVIGITEWEFNSLSMKGDLLKNDFRGYNRILIGAEGLLHNISSWKVPEGIELLLRGSFSTGAENSNIRSYHPYALQFFDRYTFSERTLVDKGPNDNGKGFIVPELGKKVDWYNFNLGFGSGFLNGMLYGDIYLSFFYQDNQLLKDELNGLEFGTSLRLSI